MFEMTREQDAVMQALAGKYGGSCKVTGREDGKAVMVPTDRHGVEQEYVLVDEDGFRAPAEYLRPGRIHTNPGSNVVRINGVKVPGSISGGGEAA